MKLGILSDTHNAIARTRFAVQLLKAEGAELLVHCGDFIDADIVAECALLPLYFVFGNNDADNIPDLRQAAVQHHAICLGWAGDFIAGDKRIAVAHGHLTTDLRPLLESKPDYLLTGHSHLRRDWLDGKTRRINPGALFRGREYSVALLDVVTDEVRFLAIPKEV